jgi:hypothetical protein
MSTRSSYVPGVVARSRPTTATHCAPSAATSTRCSPSQASGRVLLAEIGPRTIKATPPGTLAAVGSAACAEEPVNKAISRVVQDDEVAMVTILRI